jgi:hypothetical protein
MNNKKQTYVAPEMEILEIEVEQCFAASTEKFGKWYDEQQW